MEDWRNILYPIGFLANLLFAMRFFLQWMSSEKKSRSYFSASFWLISLGGSLLMSFHSFVQVQYPVCFIQTCNVILYMRNWELTRYSKESLMPIKKVFIFLAMLILIMTVGFIGQSYLSFGKLEWMRVPDFIEPKNTTISFAWNVIGFFGTFLFASRFWFHWWRAEKNYEDALNSNFWIISVVGSVFALAYFIKIFDLVNIIGYSAGLVPYLRNLSLTRKPKTI